MYLIDEARDLANAKALAEVTSGYIFRTRLQEAVRQARVLVDILERCVRIELHFDAKFAFAELTNEQEALEPD